MHSSGPVDCLKTHLDLGKIERVQAYSDSWTSYAESVKTRSDVLVLFKILENIQIARPMKILMKLLHPEFTL